MSSQQSSGAVPQQASTSRESADPHAGRSASAQNNAHPNAQSGSQANTTVRNFGRRTSGITFAVMITVLLVALVFAANQNTVLGWIIAAISAGWLLLATILVLSVRRGAQKVGETLESARADQAARNSAHSGGTVVVDEDAHARHMKLDHSFKIVQVQKKVISQELDKGSDADQEMVYRALETIEATATNGRDMLRDHVGNKPTSGEPNGPDRNTKPDGDTTTISGDIIR